LLIGTEGGMLEHWAIEKDQLVNTYEAHNKSDEGISSIIHLRNESALLWGG
jgi:hypothetical protein